MQRWFAMPLDGACRDEEPTSVDNNNLPISIEKPVGGGPAAKNQPNDVKVIQDALNRVFLAGGAGPFPFLVVDGIMGPKTLSAITKYQASLSIFDGVIEPKRRTIIELNKLLDPITEQVITGKIAAALPFVATALQAARQNVSFAIGNPLRTIGDPQQEKALDRLNRHFKFNEVPESSKQQTLRLLLETYMTFEGAVISPLRYFDIFSEFDLDGNDPKIATAPDGGFNNPAGQLDEDQKRADHIHLGLGFFDPKITPEFAAFIILHELTHFVRRSDNVPIEDHGRGWFDQQFMAPLSPDKRMTNADSFAGFAQECRTGSNLRPPFVESRPGGLKGRRG